MQETRGYIEKIRSLPCLVCGQTPVDPDHLSHRALAGKGDTITITSPDGSTEKRKLEWNYSTGIDVDIQFIDDKQIEK